MIPRPSMQTFWQEHVGIKSVNEAFKWLVPFFIVKMQIDTASLRATMMVSNYVLANKSFVPAK